MFQELRAKHFPHGRCKNKKRQQSMIVLEGEDNNIQNDEPKNTDDGSDSDKKSPQMTVINFAGLLLLHSVVVLVLFSYHTIDQRRELCSSIAITRTETPLADISSSSSSIDSRASDSSSRLTPAGDMKSSTSTSHAL